MQTQTPSVSLIRATSYEVEALRESLETLLEPLGGITAFVKSGDRVLLKPNLLTGSRPNGGMYYAPGSGLCCGDYGN